MLFFIFRPGRKLALIIIIGECFSIILDQTRLQPWEYQFLFMLACYVFCKTGKQLLICCQVIFIGIYFFSGIWKLNPGFINNVWGQLILLQWLHLPNVPYNTGYLAGLAEACAAILLIPRKTRTVGIIILVLMHIFILVMMMALGINTGIWAWNLGMPVLLILLFYRQEVDVLSIRYFFMGKLTVLLFIVMPCLYPLGYWNYFLSFKLYSGETSYLYICSSDVHARERLRLYLQRGFARSGCDSLISVYKWTMGDMNTMINPQKGMYKAIAKKWKKDFNDESASFFTWTNGKWLKLE